MGSHHSVHWDLENSKKMLAERRFFASSIALFLIVNLHHPTSIVAQAREVPAKMACRDSDTNNVTFLAFLPCLQRADNLNDTRSILKECDLLTRAAVNLAIERWNQDLTTRNYTLNVASISLISYNNDHSTNVSKLTLTGY